MFLAAAALIGSAIFVAVRVNQDAQLRLTGKITTTRVFPVEASSLVLVEFSLTNPSPLPFEVRDLEIERIDGTPSGRLNKTEIQSYMQYYKLAGPPVLGLSDKIGAGATVERMAAARFEVAPAEMKNAEYRLRLRAFDGITMEITRGNK
jgi:hypothetical protein